jgi:hypothetical protein
MLVKLDYNTLARIKIILEEFGVLSGLVCNVEKTTLTLLGPDAMPEERIVNIGFQIVNSTTILGLEIDKNGQTLGNFIKIREKIRSIITMWGPFNLSLPGRICIAKSLLYSQINYLGCFLQIPPAITNEIDQLITGFVKGKLNIAKKRLYRPPDQGGLGLFDINSFLDAQRCAWVKRSRDLNEQWKAQLYINNYGVLFNCKGKHSCNRRFPVLNTISTSFENMSNSFTIYNENFKSAFIVENVKMTRSVNSRNFIGRNFFPLEFFNLYANKILNRTYDTDLTWGLY